MHKVTAVSSPTTKRQKSSQACRQAIIIRQVFVYPWKHNNVTTTTVVVLIDDCLDVWGRIFFFNNNTMRCVFVCQFQLSKRKRRVYLLSLSVLRRVTITIANIQWPHSFWVSRFLCQAKANDRPVTAAGQTVRTRC